MYRTHDDHTGEPREGGADAADPGPAAPVTPPVPPPPTPAPFLDHDTIPGTVRKIRRLADLSQRELAAATTLSPSTIARLESGSLSPSLATLLRLLAVARLVLVVSDEQGRVVQPMRLWDDTRDGADRQFPAHLDLILDPPRGQWWADIYGLARPPETFHRDRRWRDARRLRSQWEVRVKQFRHVPPPPDPDRDRHWRSRIWSWPV